MARLIKNTQKAILGIRVSTVFANETVDREYKTGDFIENLRYVKDGEIEIVSGKLAEIRYTMATRLAWNKKTPKDTLATDMTLNSIVIDASRAYESKLVEVPVREIVEFAEEKDVVRMLCVPFIQYNMELKYSDLTMQRASIQVGDVFDQVRIMNLISADNIGPDITGKFEVIAFSYAVTGGKITINGIAFKNVDTSAIVVASLEHILALNEVYSYTIDAESNITEIIAGIENGDTVIISNEIDTTDSAITITKDDVTLDLQADVISDGSNASGIRVTGGSATISGFGEIKTETPYDRNHGSGVVSVSGDGELIFNGSGVNAVIEDDPVNKGQFGVTIYDNGKLTVNDGNFITGWYCIAGNGSKTSIDSTITINGGTFQSIADYVLYHPDQGTLVINGGYFAGAAGALAANGGNIEINGGEFHVLGEGNTGEWGDGTSGLADVTINLNARYSDIVCRITGGEFHATASGTIMIATGSAHHVDLAIFGGKFTSKPNPEWIADGYVCIEEKDLDGFYEVIPA